MASLSKERDKTRIGYCKTAFDRETDIFDKAGRLKCQSKSDGKKKILTWNSLDHLVYTRSELNDLYQVCGHPSLTIKKLTYTIQGLLKLSAKLWILYCSCTNGNGINPNIKNSLGVFGNLIL